MNPFNIRPATLAACLSLPASLSAQNILEAANDAVIRDQLCVGTNCANAQTFIDSLAGSLMLRDTRTRIDFEDASDNVNFPGDEWSILINDIFEFSSGGINHFSVQNRTDNTTPLRIEGGAPNNAIYTNAAGQVGLGTSLPQSALHVRQGTAPGIRLEAAVGDGDWLLSSTFSGFAIYDMDGGPTVPLWLENGAPSDSLFVNSAGFVGFGTNFPEEKLHIRTNAVDTDAFALFDANGSGSDSAFRLRQNGVTPTTWEFRNQQDSGRLNVGIAGGNTPLKIDNAANNNLLRLGRNGLPGEVNITGTLVVNNTALNVPDYVFDADYALRPLAEVQAFIDANSHLPGVPSEAVIKADGVDMTAMQMTLLKKVEELTLYTLAQEDMIAMQQAELRELRVLKGQMARIETLLSGQVK